MLPVDRFRTFARSAIWLKLVQGTIGGLLGVLAYVLAGESAFGWLLATLVLAQIGWRTREKKPVLDRVAHSVRFVVVGILLLVLGRSAYDEVIYRLQGTRRFDGNVVVSGDLVLKGKTPLFFVVDEQGIARVTLGITSANESFMKLKDRSGKTGYQVSADEIGIPSERKNIK